MDRYCQEITITLNTLNQRLLPSSSPLTARFLNLPLTHALLSHRETTALPLEASLLPYHPALYPGLLILRAAYPPMRDLIVDLRLQKVSL